MSIQEKILEHIGIEKILQFIVELFDFYFKPFKFFKKFFAQSLIDKIIQTSFYSLLLIGLGYILIDDITLRLLAKFLLLEIGILINACLILILSNFIISKFAHQNIKIENIVFFTILVKLFIAPFQIIFFGLFINLENYNFFFLANLVVLFLFFYMFIFSTRIFQSKIRYIISNILLNLLLLNLFAGVIHILSIDNYTTFESPYYTDQILKERIEKGNLLSEYYNFPSYRVLYKIDNESVASHFLFSTPFDTVASGSFKVTEEYESNIKKNIAILDTMISNLHFKRNREFFEELNILYKSIDSLMVKRVITYTDKDIEKITVYMKTDSIESHKEILIRTPISIEQRDLNLTLNQMNIEKVSEYSAIPLEIISYIYYPISKLIPNEEKNAP
jgi:hypothetical protein